MLTPSSMLIGCSNTVREFHYHGNNVVDKIKDIGYQGINTQLSILHSEEYLEGVSGVLLVYQGRIQASYRANVAVRMKGNGIYFRISLTRKWNVGDPMQWAIAN